MKEIPALFDNYCDRAFMSALSTLLLLQMLYSSFFLSFVLPLFGLFIPLSNRNLRSLLLYKNKRDRLSNGHRNQYILRSCILNKK